MMTGLDLPPPSRGQRVTSPRCGLGTGRPPGTPQRVRGGKLPTGAVVLAMGTLSCIDQAEPSGVCLRIDSIETSTDNLIYYRGHRDDQSDYRFGPDRCRPWPWFSYASGQCPTAQCPTKGLPCAQAPSKCPPVPSKACPRRAPGPQQVLAGRPGSEQVRPDDPLRTPVAGQVRPAVLMTRSRARGPSQDGPAPFVTGGGVPHSGNTAVTVSGGRRRAQTPERGWWDVTHCSYSMCNCATFVTIGPGRGISPCCRASP